jgi:hypothetical protein
MISNRLAGNILVAGLVLGFSWLGYCAARDFVQASSSYHSK